MATLVSTKSLSKISRHFYWPGMSADIRAFISTCQLCAARKSATTSEASLQSTRADYPNQLVALDLVGPLPITHHGNQYILVCMDYFTQWPEAYALPSMTSATVASVFVINWICRFGVPEQLHSDQGRQFESTLFAEI